MQGSIDFIGFEHSQPFRDVSMTEIRVKKMWYSCRHFTTRTSDATVEKISHLSDYLFVSQGPLRCPRDDILMAWTSMPWSISPGFSSISSLSCEQLQSTLRRNRQFWTRSLSSAATALHLGLTGHLQDVLHVVLRFANGHGRLYLFRTLHAKRSLIWCVMSFTNRSWAIACATSATSCLISFQFSISSNRQVWQREGKASPTGLWTSFPPLIPVCDNSLRLGSDGSATFIFCFGGSRAQSRSTINSIKEWPFDANSLLIAILRFAWRRRTGSAYPSERPCTWL